MQWTREVVPGHFLLGVGLRCHFLIKCDMTIYYRTACWHVWYTLWRIIGKYILRIDFLIYNKKSIVFIGLQKAITSVVHLEYDLSLIKLFCSYYNKKTRFLIFTRVYEILSYYDSVGNHVYFLSSHRTRYDHHNRMTITSNLINFDTRKNQWIKSTITLIPTIDLHHNS